MKTLKINNNEVKVTKSFIKEIFELERPVSYYSHLDGNILANAITTASQFFGWDGLEKKQDKIDDTYNEIEGLVDSYIAYQKHLEENTL